MTSLMNWVRLADLRRATTGIALGSLACALAGCQGDRASNADAREPIATTAAGVAIMEVNQNENERVVEAVVVAGGEERQVTIEPVLDGPLPFAVSARIDGAGDDEPTSVAYGWDSSTGETWYRQASAEGEMEMTLAVANGLVTEEYTFDGQSVRLQYPVLPATIVDKTLGKFQRGEPLDAVSPEVSDFVDALRTFEAFAAALPNSTGSDHDANLLTSLLGDPVFGTAIAGERPRPERPDLMCRSFNVCMAISCKLIANATVCTVCTAGSLACLFLDWVCYMWCNAGG